MSEEQKDHLEQIPSTPKEQEVMAPQLANFKAPLGEFVEKLDELPLSNKEKRKKLTPEFLSSLNLDEYIALWKRLNPQFLTHVTRHGFRDHTWLYHSAGKNEFHEGFTLSMKDEALLRPPIALRHNLRSRDPEAVESFISKILEKSIDEYDSRLELNNLLHLSMGSAPKYADETAVHFVAQSVSDHLYGGETGNEIFFVYPSDVLASQHDFAFNGWHKDFTKVQSDTWNDVFFWPKTVDNPGLAIDAGIVFLPKSSRVDPETGSSYESQNDGETLLMVENTDLVSKFIDWRKGLSIVHPIVKAYLAKEDPKNKFNWGLPDPEKLIYEALIGLGFDEVNAKKLQGKLIQTVYEISADFNYKAPVSERAIKLLKDTNTLWKRAENTITSEEYWTKYFEENPEAKPAHIVFYDGDPTEAVHKFIKENGIGEGDTSAEEGELLGFEDKLVRKMAEDPRANRGYAELEFEANKLITKKFHSEYGRLDEISGFNKKEFFIKASGTWDRSTEVPQAYDRIGLFCSNNGTLAFVDECGDYWVGDDTPESYDALRKAGYTHEYMYVPHSNDGWVWMNRNFHDRDREF